MGELLCVALMLPQPLRARLDGVRRIVAPERRHMTAHLTLVPPTQPPDREVATVLVTEVARTTPPLHLSLCGAESFHRSATVYLRPVGDLVDLRRLHAQVSTAPFSPPTRQFHPHVTIATRCAPPMRAALLEAFADFRAELELDAITVFAHGPSGWAAVSEGRMGGSRA